jgi:hypothetical protein
MTLRRETSDDDRGVGEILNDFDQQRIRHYVIY